MAAPGDPWWVFQLPEATCYVPAMTEEEARRAMQSNMYKGCPWPFTVPLIGTRWALRAELHKGDPP